MTNKHGRSFVDSYTSKLSGEYFIQFTDCCKSLPLVAGFGTGPPLSTCLTLFPKHGGQEAQTTNPPFKITIQENEYSPGQDIHSM